MNNKTKMKGSNTMLKTKKVHFKMSILLLIITSNIFAQKIDLTAAIKNIQQQSFFTAINGCNKGSAFFCHMAISFYRNGEGVDKDENKANELYENSLKRFQNQCEKDKFIGCYELGNFISDKTLRLKYYEISCDQHNGLACAAIDETLEWGGNIKELYPLDKSVYKKSCEEGKESACVILDCMDKNY